MQATVMYGPGDVRVEERPDPTILVPTDAIIRLSASCICGSDLWPYMPDLIGRVLDGKINPGKVFDLSVPLEQVAEGYRAMDERRAIKTLLQT